MHKCTNSRFENSKTKHNLGNLDSLNLRVNNLDNIQEEIEGPAGDSVYSLNNFTCDSSYSLPVKRCEVGCQSKPTNLPSGCDQSKIFRTLPTESLLRIEKKLENFHNPFKWKNNLKSQKNPHLSLAKSEDTRIRFSSKETTSSITETKMDNTESTRAHFTKSSAMDAILSQAGFSGLGSIIGDTPVRQANKISTEYENKQTSEILDPELNLSRLGYTGSEAIDWHKIDLPDKRDLYVELHKRITNKKNADCKVHIDKEEFSCHLIVLQCYSELFDGYVAIKKVEIPADKCNASSFAFIYDWMVSDNKSYQELTRDNVLDIFNSAKYLKIKDLVEQCWAFFDNIEVFNEDTAFLLYCEAKSRNMYEVQELMIPRIQEFFLMLVSSQDWLQLELDDVKALLTSNYIKINCEMEIFMSAVRWLKHDYEHRDKLKYELLTCVRFGNIAPWQLVDIKRNPENPEFMEVAKDPNVCKLIDDGLAYVIIKYWYGEENEDFKHWNSMLGLQEPPPRNWSGLDKTYFTYREFLIYLDQYRRNQLIEKSKPRLNSEKRFPMPNSSSPSTPRNDVVSPLIKKTITVMPVVTSTFHNPFVRHHHHPSSSKFVEKLSCPSFLKIFTPSKNFLALSKLNSLSASALAPTFKNYASQHTLFFTDKEAILVFGGCDPYRAYNEMNSGREIFRYLQISNEWEWVGSMPEPRHHHKVEFLKGRVFLTGGADPRIRDIKGAETVVDTTWSFEPVIREWFSEGNLIIGRKHFGLVASNKCLFAIGGLDNSGRALNSIEVYDNGKWIFKTSMKYSRSCLACAKYRSYIWAAGGRSQESTFLDVVEGYDINSDQWTEITALETPRALSCMLTMSDNLYIIGGVGSHYHKDQNSTSLSTGKIDVWCTDELIWKTVKELSIPRHAHAIGFCGTQILCLGGVTTLYLKCLNNVECFCIKRDSLIQGVAPLPANLSGHCAVTLPPSNLISY